MIQSSRLYDSDSHRSLSPSQSADVVLPNRLEDLTHLLFQYFCHPHGYTLQVLLIMVRVCESEWSNRMMGHLSQALPWRSLTLVGSLKDRACRGLASESL